MLRLILVSILFAGISPLHAQIFEGGTKGGLFFEDTSALSLKTQTIADAQDVLFFADAITGGGWNVQIAVSNNSAFYSLVAGAAFAVDRTTPGAVPLDEALEQFTLPPNGSHVLKTSPEGPTIRGGVLIAQLSGFGPLELDTQMMSAVLTYRHHSGLEVSVPPIRTKDLQSPFFGFEPAYSTFVEHSETVSGGMALWGEPSAGDACMYLVDLDGLLFRDPEGYSHVCSGRSSGTIESHAALTLEQWFPSWDFSEGFQGRWIVYVRNNTIGKHNDGFILPMVLRFSKDLKSMSAMPMVPILAPIDF